MTVYENLVALLVSIPVILSGMELVRKALANLNNPVTLELPEVALDGAIFSVFMFV